MTTLNLALGANADDKEQGNANNDSGKVPGNMSLAPVDDTVLNPGSHASNQEICAACRFTNVTIPQGATINSADFSMRANATYNASPNVVKFHASCQAHDNAPAIGTSGSGADDLGSNNRTRTTADTAWTQTSVTGSTRYTASITGAVQEVINRAGWVSGNALLVHIDTHADTTQGEWQDYDSFNGVGATDGPKLDIDYTSGAATKLPLRNRRPNYVWPRRRVA